MGPAGRNVRGVNFRKLRSESLARQGVFSPFFLLLSAKLPSFQGTFTESLTFIVPGQIILGSRQHKCHDQNTVWYGLVRNSFYVGLVWDGSGLIKGQLPVLESESPRAGTQMALTSQRLPCAIDDRHLSQGGSCTSICGFRNGGSILVFESRRRQGPVLREGWDSARVLINALYLHKPSGSTT
jgi:hypothetical protein